MYRRIDNSKRTSLLLLQLCILFAIAAFALAVYSIAKPVPSSPGGSGINTINGITPNLGDFVIGGDFGISIIPQIGGIVVRNTATIALVEPAEFIVSGSPLNGNGGTITVSKATQAARSFWGGPTSGSPAVPTFRSLISTDIPSALSLSTLTISGDTLLGQNTSCIMPLLPSCYDISNQQCVGGPLAGNCLPPNAAFNSLVVGTLTVLNGTSNGTSLNNTFLGDTFLNGSLTCVGNGSISNGCLNLGGYTCPMGQPLAESCIPASLVQYDMTVTNNLTVVGPLVTCAGGFLSASCIPPDPVVLDANATLLKYPDASNTKGVWYGLNTKANAFDSSTVTIGNNADTGAVNAIAAGTLASSLGSATIAIGLLASASGGRCISVGPQASCILGTGVAIGDQANTTTRGISIGGNSISTVDALAVGYFALGSGITSTAVGNTATASGISSIAIGQLSLASATQSVAVGVFSFASGNNAAAFGLGAVANAAGAVAVGDTSTASGINSVAVGSASGVDVTGGVAIGSLSSTAGIANSIILNARNLPTSPLDPAHAFGLGINAASVNPGTLGITVNNLAYQLQLYSADYITTATTGSTTTLTVTSAQKQRFSGTLTQTVVLPVVTTLANGFQFQILNDATAIVTVQTSGGNVLATLTTGLSGWATVVNIASGTGTASWHFSYGLSSPPPGVAIVLDNLATPTYPTSPQTEGVWYGPGARAGSGTATSIAIGVNPIAASAYSISIGWNAYSTLASLAIGTYTNATSNSACFGHGAHCEELGVSIGFFATQYGSTGAAGIAIGLMSLSQPECIAIGGLTTTDQFGMAIGSASNATGLASTVLGRCASANAIDYSVTIGATVGTLVDSGCNIPPSGPLDAAHAFALNINNATVNPGTLGITVNKLPYQLPLYSADYATTITTGGTTTLSVTSAQKQRFSGTLTQIVVLPVVTTLANGFQFQILNDATAPVTVQTSGLITLATLLPNSNGWATVVDVTGGTGTASWHFGYSSPSSVIMDNLATGAKYPTAPQTEGVWYGPGAKSGCATGTSIAIGVTPTTTISNDIAIGTNATALGNSGVGETIAIGHNTNATSFSISIGTSGLAVSASVAEGYLTTATSVSVSLGILAFADSFSFAVGISSYAQTSSAAIGAGSKATNSSIAIGADAIASISSVVVGANATSNNVPNSVTLGVSPVQFYGPQNAAHAFALNINTASVNPGTLGITVNNAPYQLPLYSADFATTGTTGGITALSVTSAKKQFFTGTSAQTVILPDVATLAPGFEFKISNLSTGAITVNAFNGALVGTLAGTTAPTTKWGYFTCINVAGVGTAGWAYDAGA